LAILKWLLIATLAVVGVLLLFNGLGTPLPFIASRALGTAGVPLGVICIGASIAIAYLWKNEPGERDGSAQPPR